MLAASRAGATYGDVAARAATRPTPRPGIRARGASTTRAARSATASASSRSSRRRRDSRWFGTRDRGRPRASPGIRASPAAARPRTRILVERRRPAPADRHRRLAARARTAAAHASSTSRPGRRRVKADDALERLGLAARAGRGERALSRTARDFRIEIPSVEGPRVLEEVVRSGRGRRASSSTASRRAAGAMLLRESELREMAEIGAEAGHRGLAVRRAARGLRHRRARALGRRRRALRASCAACAACATRPRTSRAPCECGHPQLPDRRPRAARAAHATCRRAGELPGDIVWKISVMMAPSNPLGLRELERLGASTVEHPVRRRPSSSSPRCGAASSLPIDLYVESPDALGGVVRGNELGDLIRAGAPLYAKFGLRNARDDLPLPARTSSHEACAIAREKVHRAAVALEWLEPPRARARPVGAGRARARRPAARRERQDGPMIDNAKEGRCGGSSSRARRSPQSPRSPGRRSPRRARSRRSVTLTLWHNYGTEGNAVATNNLVAAFEKQNPNIKIKVVSQPGDNYFAAAAGRRGSPTRRPISSVEWTGLFDTKYEKSAAQPEAVLHGGRAEQDQRRHVVVVELQPRRRACS